MSGTMHTPGPWVVGMENGYNPNTLFSDGDNGIASVFGVPMHCHIADLKDTRDAEPLANARLIAAAPDMLEVLKMLRDADDMALEEGWSCAMGLDQRIAVDSAIAKATQS